MHARAGTHARSLSAGEAKVVQRPEWLTRPRRGAWTWRGSDRGMMRSVWRMACDAVSRQRQPLGFRDVPRSLNMNSAAARQMMLVALLLVRSEEHTSELQSHHDLVCRLLLEKK